MDLFAVRVQLAKAVYETDVDGLTKGSNAWRAQQAAKGALDQFDLDHPQVVMELYARFEEYAANAVGDGQK